MGCSQEPPPRRFESAAAAQVQTRTFRFGDAQLIVIDIPVQSGRRVEFARCFVWRSEKSDALHCPAETDAAVTLLPDDPLSAADRH